MTSFIEGKDGRLYASHTVRRVIPLKGGGSKVYFDCHDGEDYFESWSDADDIRTRLAPVIPNTIAAQALEMIELEDGETVIAVASPIVAWRILEAYAVPIGCTDTETPEHVLLPDGSVVRNGVMRFDSVDQAIKDFKRHSSSD